MKEYTKENKSCPRCGDLVGQVLDRKVTAVNYLSLKRYAQIVTVFCDNCGLVYQEEDRDTSKQIVKEV